MISDISLKDLDSIENIGMLSLPIYYKQKELKHLINNKCYLLHKITYFNNISGFHISKLHNDRIHIMSISVHPEKRNNKLGTILLDHLKKYKLPIIAVGMGEKEDDLQPFKAELFTKTLLSIS